MIEMSYEHCLPIFDTFYENIHYLCQFVYLFGAICLNYRILYVIWVSQRLFYSNQSFYNLYSIDCALSILAMSLDLCCTRLFLFIPQFCAFLSGLVSSSVVFMRVYYSTTCYFKAVKPIIHIFIAVNRMSCVLFPTTYSQNWAQKMRLMMMVIFTAPFLVIWNTTISDNYLIFVYGGFTVTYTRRVSWASLSLMQFSLIIITVIITMITTFITFCKMRNMKKRIKSSERSLCIAASLISTGFLLEALNQSFFAFFKDAPWLADVIGYIQFSTWDLLNVGTPLIMLLVSQQFRRHVLHLKRFRTQRVGSINMTHLGDHRHPTTSKLSELCDSLSHRNSSQCTRARSRG